MTHRIFHIRLLTLSLLLAAAIGCSAQTALFEKFEDTKGVTTIFISKTMLGMIPDVKAGRHDIGKIAGKLDQLRILSCENPALIPQIREFAKKTYLSEKYEAIMKLNEDGEKVTIYQRSLKGGKNEFSLFTEESNEIGIIYVTGSIALKDIQEITGK